MEDSAGTVNDKSMRISQKKQIENNLNLLDRAHDAIKKALETKNTECALMLLEQTQDLAIQIGGMIEEALGEDFATVGILESYCEQIYQTYEMIRQQQALNINKTCKRLQKELIRIENSVKNDIHVRVTAVFLPYKASMWDSLESVWKAADADPDCDAYVIPIPYFDKNPDGSFKEAFYEGNLYPDYVPITRYDAYDFEAHRPDMILIHNPYDDSNYVTSVHPFFYSSNLKNFTDNLVYIPYFISKEVHPDNLTEIKKMEHYCTVFGVLNADTVIVQSQAMKEVYVKVLTELAGEETRKYWERKIAGLGSPKIEKVQSTKKEEIDIPDEWKEIMKRKSGCKVVLYNTHLNLLMQNNYEFFIPKLRETLEYFKSRTDIVLLWRPHPLSNATAQAMNPCAVESYESIVEKYKWEKWGIYDDTPNLARAIALSDAYYGSVSSLLVLYEATGKPMLIHKINITEEEEW